VRQSAYSSELTAKAFLHPSRGEICAFCGSDLLRIRFDVPPRESVHPEQAAAELYNAIARNGEALLELETHGPFSTLQPGQSMDLALRWDLLRYGGQDEERERLAFLNGLGE